MTGRLELGGVLGRPSDAARDLNRGPQMLRRAAAVRPNSLYSRWDDQFSPGLRSWLLRVSCDPGGGMELDREFFVDFGEPPAGPARAHEVRLQDDDCTTGIFQ